MFVLRLLPVFWQVLRRLGLRVLLRPIRNPQRLRDLGHWFLVLSVVVAALGLSPHVEAAPVLPPECLELTHHVLSEWVVNGLRDGIGVAWVKGSSMIYAVQVAECGNAWLIAVWRDGQFRSNFFPKLNLYTKVGFREVTRLAWAYIIVQARSFSAIAVLAVSNMMADVLIAPDPAELCQVWPGNQMRPSWCPVVKA